MMKLKKIAVVVLALAMIFALAACGDDTAKVDDSKSLEGTTIKVAASPTPHAEILNIAKDLLAAKGITLEVITFTDYVQPNMVTESGEVDANYFQHEPYLIDFNKDNDTHLVSVAAIHYEPYGLYPGQTATIEELKDGDKIAVPNDGTNEGRALLLLEAQGLIKLKEGVGLNATKLDIAENPKNIEIVEMEAAQLPRTLKDVNMAVINGNYAIEAGLSVATDAVAIEDAESEAAVTYANILVVKEGNEENPAILALIDALKSAEVKTFIDDTYDGAVIAMF